MSTPAPEHQFLYLPATGDEVTALPPGKWNWSRGDKDEVAGRLPFGRGDGAWVNFVAWERLRLAYNLCLLIVFTLAALHAYAYDVDVVATLPQAAVLAVAANVCYCVGPVLTLYLVWLGANRVAMTAVLFAMGLLISVFLTLAAALALFSPRW